MNLSISNIAWSTEHDSEMYSFLQTNGYTGLEIAPTRIFPNNPYDHISEAKDFVIALKEKYNLVISSMQSIWYGRQEKIFGNMAERKALVDYTEKACKFANAIGCKNLVFGNPKNRDTEDVAGNYLIAIDFFHTIGEIALENNTTISIEPNPTIYNTRFLNYTEQAVEMAYKANTKGVKVNYDLGTVIQNGEDISYVNEISEYVHHIHISEPFLKPVNECHRHLHLYLLEYAQQLNDVYVSIEMGKCEQSIVKAKMDYLKELKYEIQ